MSNPANLKYSESHEWVKVKGNIAYIGITDHAQEELGDIVYVELPEIDDELDKGDEAANIESVKAAAPVYTPISGRVVEVNESLADAAEQLNEDAFGNFLFALEMSEPGELEELMDVAGYEDFLKDQ